MKRTQVFGQSELLAVICSALMAVQPALGARGSVVVGTVAGGAQVALEGIAVPVGTLVFSGNTIETGPSEGASVALEGGASLVLGKLTSAQVVASPAGYRVRLDHGSLLAGSEGARPILLTLRDLTVRTKQPRGAFEVAWDGSRITVAARRGAVLLDVDDRTVEIPEGKALGAQAGSTTGGSGSAGHPWLIGGIAAAAAAGLGLGLAFGTAGSSCGSPHRLSCQ